MYRALLVLVLLIFSVSAQSIEPPPARVLYEADGGAGWPAFEIIQNTEVGTIAVGRATPDLQIHYLDSGRSEVIARNVRSTDGERFARDWGIVWHQEPIVTWMEEDTSTSPNKRMVNYATWQNGQWLQGAVHSMHQPPQFNEGQAPNHIRLSLPVATSSGFGVAMAEPSNDGSSIGHVIWQTFDGAWSEQEVHTLENGQEFYGPLVASVAADGTRHVLVGVVDQTSDPPARFTLHANDQGGDWTSGDVPGAAWVGMHRGQAAMEGDLLTAVVTDNQFDIRLAQYDGSSWSLGDVIYETPDGKVHASVAISLAGAPAVTVRDFGTDHFFVGPPPWTSWTSESGMWLDNMAALGEGIVGRSEIASGNLEFVKAQAINEAIHARFEASSHQVSTRESLTLVEASILDAGAWIESVHWELPSGTASGDTIQTIISTPGRHWISILVTDNFGYHDIGTAPVDVVRIGPDACINVAAAATTGQAVSFKDCSSHPESDLGAMLESFAWDFGDGATSTQKDPSHTYTSAGTYEVTLLVTDEQGAMDETTQSITVSNPPPNQKPDVDFSYEPANPVAGQEVAFSATASDSDGSIASTSWTVDGVDAGSGTSLTRTFTKAGSVGVVFTATDDEGASSSVTKNVVVQAPAAPELSLSKTQFSETAGQELEVTLTVENPNPVSITIDLASDAPDGWNASLSATALELDAGASQDVTFSFAPPYFEGGLTIIKLRATANEETKTALLRVQLQPGQAPDDQDDNSEANGEDANDGTGGEGNTASVQHSTDSQNDGLPTWVWFAGGGTLAFGGVAVGLALLLRRP